MYLGIDETDNIKEKGTKKIIKESLRRLRLTLKVDHLLLMNNMKLLGIET